MAQVKTIFQRANEVFGDPDRAQGWMNEPNPALGGRCPNECLDSNQRVERVEELLLQIEYGLLH